MGNMGSCISSQSNDNNNMAQVIDIHRNIRQLVDVPLTAAELMLEHPGYVLSPFHGLGSDKRLSALKADESLSGGGVYLLIPVTRVHSKVSESEMAAIQSSCDRRNSKQRSSSKVLPMVNVDASTLATEGINNISANKSEQGTDIGIVRCRARQWIPALEPICEEI